MKKIEEVFLEYIKYGTNIELLFAVGDLERVPLIKVKFIEVELLMQNHCKKKYMVKKEKIDIRAIKWQPNFKIETEVSKLIKEKTTKIKDVLGVKIEIQVNSSLRNTFIAILNKDDDERKMWLNIKEMFIEDGKLDKNEKLNYLSIMDPLDIHSGAKNEKLRDVILYKPFSKKDKKKSKIDKVAVKIEKPQATSVYKNLMNLIKEQAGKKSEKEKSNRLKDMITETLGHLFNGNEIHMIVPKTNQYKDDFINDLVKNTVALNDISNDVPISENDRENTFIDIEKGLKENGIDSLDNNSTYQDPFRSKEKDTIKDVCSFSFYVIFPNGQNEFFVLNKINKEMLIVKVISSTKLRVMTLGTLESLSKMTQIDLNKISKITLPMEILEYTLKNYIWEHQKTNLLINPHEQELFNHLVELYS